MLVGFKALSLHHRESGKGQISVKKKKSLLQKEWVYEKGKNPTCNNNALYLKTLSVIFDIELYGFESM